MRINAGRMRRLFHEMPGNPPELRQSIGGVGRALAWPRLFPIAQQ